MAYPDYIKVFEIYTDASSKQIGVVITQDNKPIVFFSRKLSNNTQRKYSITEFELLAIVETLEYFKGTLWNQQIKVFTDHANLMRDALGLTSDQVYRYRLLLEEYGPKIVYIKGIHNTVADTVLRLSEIAGCAACAPMWSLATMCLFGWHSFITPKPTGFYTSLNTRDGIKSVN